ncbi:MAG: ATP-binding protein [Candidatus Gastranaerophilales bacterium]|nr:ATP-binding protein [Candidatus Gastranaerophilales bacterium]
MEKIKMRFGAKPENINSSVDLFYLESYALFGENAPALKKAGIMFDETADLKAVDDFLRKEYCAIQAEKYKKQANLSKRFSKRTFATFKIENDTQKSAYDKAREYAKNIKSHIETGTNILFVGKGHVGTGKTHLACAIANDVLEQGIPVKVLNVVALVDELKEFTQARKQELKTVKVLLIDDLGKENSTTWLCSEIYGIINARYENELPTIITTEGNLKDLEDNYKIEIDEKIVNKGKSMVSRLTESCFLAVLDCDDYRKKAGTKCD